MNSHPHLELRLDRERRQREIRQARQHRLVGREARPPRRPVRRAVGRSLIRLGNLLAGEGERPLEPARPR